jgi:hypothetical protein
MRRPTPIFRLTHFKQKSRPKAALRVKRLQVSLDLGFLEINMLSHDRVVLLHAHLFRHRAAVLLRDIKEAGVGGRQELDLDGGSFGHFCYPYEKLKRWASALRKLAGHRVSAFESQPRCRTKVR